MNSNFISISEIFIVIPLTLTLITPLNLINKNNRLSIIHPLIFYSLIMFYYTVFSPVLQIAINETSSKGFEFRDQYLLGFQGALLSSVAVLIGYSLKIKVNKNVSNFSNYNYKNLWSIGLILNIVGFSLYMISTGF